MLEGKQAEYRRELVAGVAGRLGGEDARVIAMTQAGVAPWAPALLIGLAGVIVVGSLFVGRLPVWAVVAAAIVAAAAAWFMTAIPRRMLVRTEARLYVFEMSRGQREATGEPVAVLEPGELPHDPAAVPAEIAGERLWPNYGAGRERDAMREALSRVLPS